MLEKEDYMDPECVLCGKPGEAVTVKPIPMGRVMDKLKEYEERNDISGAERHLKYWLEEAEMNRDERGQLTLNNELMGHYRMRGKGEEAKKHARRALELLDRLGMEDTITAGTTCVNAGTVMEAFGDTEAGLELFERARASYENNLPEDDQRLGGLYNNMALALTAVGRYREAGLLFRSALRVMEKQENGELESAITLLNMADAEEAEKGPEEAEKAIYGYLEEASGLLGTESLPRNAYYAFVCEKCAPVFGRYGCFAEERELTARAAEIREKHR